MCKKFLKKRKDIKYPRIRKRQAGFFSLQICSIVMLILIVAGGVYYLALINNNATAGYKIADFEKKILDLKESNQKLEMELIELQQLSRIEQEAEKMQMVLSQEVSYLTSSDEGLAAVR